MLYQLSEHDLLPEGRVIIPQESEINWSSVEPDDFARILSEQADWLDKKSFVSFPNLWTTIEAAYWNEEFWELIEEKFNTVDWKEISGQKYWKVYFIDSKEKPAKAYVCWKEIIVSGRSFWIFKSVINWMATYVNDDLLPMHSGVIDTNIWGIVFIGWRGAGKTTTSVNAMEIFDKKWLKPKLLSDDWTWARIDDIGQTSVHTVDGSVSLNSKIKRENWDLSIFDKVPADILERRKMSFKPHSLYWHTMRYSTQLRAIILLTWESKDVPKWNIHYPRFVIDSAYHYPYVDNKKDEHVKMWRNSLVWTTTSVYSREMPVKEYLDMLSDRLLSIL
jgi:hypothetical protein